MSAKSGDDFTAMFLAPGASVTVDVFSVQLADGTDVLRIEDGGEIYMENLTETDPEDAGIWYNDSGTVKISQGA